jgi:hypothetical protein
LGVDLGSKELTYGKKVFRDQNENFWKKNNQLWIMRWWTIKMATILYPSALFSVN